MRRGQIQTGRGVITPVGNITPISNAPIVSGPSNFEIVDIKKFPKGTVKKTWIDPSDYTVLKSQMFTNLQDAQNYKADSKGNNYLYFQLQGADKNGYSWKLLPYGQHKEYVGGMKIKDNPLAKYGIPLLALAGVFFIGKELVKKLK